MQNLHQDELRLIGLISDPKEVCALRRVNRDCNEALSDFEEYFRPKVKEISSLTPIESINSLSNYEQIFITIDGCLRYRGNLSEDSNYSYVLIMVALHTPKLFDKIFSGLRGILPLFIYLARYPNIHAFICNNPFVITKFAQSEHDWLREYFDHLCFNPDSYNNFILSEKMMSAVVFSHHWSNSEIACVCGHLAAYPHDPSCMRTARDSFGDPQAIWALLKSLKPYKPFARPTKETRPLPPPPIKGNPHQAIPIQPSKSPNSPAPAVERNPGSVLSTVDQNLATTSIKTTQQHRFLCTPCNNPLHLAVESGEIEAVRYFSGNLSLHVPNKSGDFPIHIAIQKGSEAMVKMLRRESSIPGCVDRNGLSPLQLAENLGNNTIIKILSEPYENSSSEIYCPK